MRRVQALRSVVGACAVAAALAGIAACGGNDSAKSASTGKAAASKDFGTLRLAVDGDVLKWSLFYIARHDKLFEKQGFSNVEWTVLGGAKPIAALVGGSADLALVANSTDTFNALAAPSGPDLRALMGTYRGYDAKFILSAKALAEVKSRGVTLQSPLAARVKALKGMTLATTSPGSTGDALMRKMLKDVGMNPASDARIAYLNTTPALIAGLTGGQADMIFSGEPTISAMSTSGKGQVYIDPGKDIPAFRDTEYSAVFASAKSITANPAKYQAILRALLQAHKRLTGDPAGAKAEVATFFPDTPPKVFDLAWQHSVAAISASPVLQDDVMQRTIDAYGLGDKLQASKVLMNQVIDKAQSQVGSG